MNNISNTSQCSSTIWENKGLGYYFSSLSHLIGLKL